MEDSSFTGLELDCRPWALPGTALLPWAAAREGCIKWADRLNSCRINNMDKDGLLTHKAKVKEEDNGVKDSNSWHSEH